MTEPRPDSPVGPAVETSQHHHKTKQNKTKQNKTKQNANANQQRLESSPGV
ncbi:hypothetical protein THAOC_30249, partial [Thalassiosira oceanica]